MILKNIISVALFFTFLIAYSLKLIQQSMQSKTKAYVLGNGNKAKKTQFVELLVKVSSFLWAITWLSNAIFDSYISEIMWTVGGTYSFWILGLIITGSGVLLFIKAMIDMKNSWRVGIDKATKSNLITIGAYQFSRNPAFVGFDVMFIGLVITYPNLLTLFIVSLNVISLHLLILQEERHLLESFGDNYSEYMKKIPRYF